MLSLRRAAPLSFFALITALGVYANASAHPLDEGRQDVVFSVKDGHLEWTHDLWLGPLLAMPLWARDIDANQDLAMSSGEREAYARRFAEAVRLELDGLPVPVNVASFDVGPYRRFVAQPAAPQVRVVFTAPIGSGQHALTYRTQLDPDRIKLAARFPSGGGVRVDNLSVADGVFAAAVAVKPDALLAGETPRLAGAAPAPARALSLPVLPVVAGLVGAGLAVCAVAVMLAMRRHGRARAR